MSCNIKLDNYNDDSYSSDSIIQGRVICHFRENTEIRSIVVKIRGKEHTGWNKKRGKHNVHYSGDVTFVSQELTVNGAGTLCHGWHEYPFQFYLPPNAPDTFKNDHGRIEYYIKAKVDIPWAPDYEDKETFNVRTPIDLNKMSELAMLPLRREEEKNICSLFCGGGFIKMNIFLEKAGFLLIEKPKVRLHIVNMSNASIQSVTVKLMLNVVSKATRPREDIKTDKELIAATYQSGVGAHGDRIYNFDLYIPTQSTVPNFGTATLLSQNVTLIVEAILPPCHTNMEIDNMRVILGHIPLEGTIVVNSALEPVQLPIGSDYTEPSAPPPGDDVPSAPLLTYNSREETEQLPPSYEDALRIEMSNQ